MFPSALPKYFIAHQPPATSHQLQQFNSSQITMVVTVPKVSRRLNIDLSSGKRNEISGNKNKEGRKRKMRTWKLLNLMRHKWKKSRRRFLYCLVLGVTKWLSECTFQRLRCETGNLTSLFRSLLAKTWGFFSLSFFFFPPLLLSPSNFFRHSIFRITREWKNFSRAGSDKLGVERENERLIWESKTLRDRF